MAMRGREGKLIVLLAVSALMAAFGFTVVEDSKWTGDFVYYKTRSRQPRPPRPEPPLPQEQGSEPPVVRVT